MTLTFRKTGLSRRKMLELLSGLEEGDARTLYLPPHPEKEELEASLGKLGETTDIVRQILDITLKSGTGAVIFRGSRKKLLVIPPFPLEEEQITDGFNPDPLRAMLTRDYIIALVLVRLGSYAIGVYKGEKRLGSKTGTGLVHGRHRQGGSSAHRFERHRDKQIEQFLLRVCRHAREQIEPYVKSLNYIVYGGARTTILTLQKYCPLLMDLETPAVPPLLDIPEPRQAVLESAAARVWTSTVYEWRED